MLHRGIEYSIVQGIERHHWKWLRLSQEPRSPGHGSTRDADIENAKKAIARAIQTQCFKQIQMEEDRDDF
jgi:hypothetical protein